MTNPRERIVIAGGSGFVGSALAEALMHRSADESAEPQAAEVVILTRTPRHGAHGVRYVQWDGRTLGDWKIEIDGAKAVINLAGKNVNCRYTRRALTEIDDSRVDSVRIIAEAINGCASQPKVWVQASTTAIYGDAGERWCDESTPPGEGVPVETATKWERAFDESPTPGVRRVVLRMSFVLGRGGGALGTLSRLTRCFLGGAAGSGRQFISWIHIDDLVRLFIRAIEDDRMSGIYNATGPAPVTNAQFMGELRRALRRPWSPPVPAMMVRLGCFLMATEPVLALTGRRVAPKRLDEMGVEFRFRELREALEDLMG
jgi:uncharacterized protein